MRQLTNQLVPNTNIQHKWCHQYRQKYFFFTLIKVFGLTSQMYRTHPQPMETIQWISQSNNLVLIKKKKNLSNGTKRSGYKQTFFLCCTVIIQWCPSFLELTPPHWMILEAEISHADWHHVLQVWRKKISMLCTRKSSTSVRLISMFMYVEVQTKYNIPKH